MANNLIDELLKVTLANDGGSTASANPASDALRALTTQFESLRGLYQAQNAQTAENTAAVVQSTRSRASEALSTVGGVARSAGSALGGGVTLLPLISSLAKLFGFGDDQGDLPTLAPFRLPASVSLAGAVNRDGSSAVSGVSYGQNGLPRTAGTDAAGIPSITVNVKTFDSRSFLDHSDDIARAVREAMLNTNSLNDVISEV